jgi:hypothetical protein
MGWFLGCFDQEVQKAGGQILQETQFISAIHFFQKPKLFKVL